MAEAVADALGVRLEQVVDGSEALDAPAGPLKLNFDEFHPLDHSPWSRACREWSGGPLRHLKLEWQFRAKSALARKTSCRAGVHFPVTVVAHGRGWRACAHCFRSETPRRVVRQ